MNYPLHLRFKILTLGNRISITDQSGALLMYAKQKLFKLKEAISVFGDETQTQLKYSISADRIIDFSANYSFSDAQHKSLGTIRRKGMKSLWKANYEITNPQTMLMTVTEENPWAKFFDSLVGELPIIGMFTGYMFHPSYIVKNVQGKELMRLKKQSAFLEGYYTIDKLDASLKEHDETSIILGLFTVVLLERSRGSVKLNSYGT